MCGRRACGTVTEPSAFWWVSRIATMVRVHRAQGAVERRDRLGAALVGGEAAADVEAAALELGAVGGRGELAVAALGRDPGLAVELADRRQPEVAGRRVDDAVGELELVEELLLPGQQPLVLGVGLLEGRVDEHLDLVEPVHPDDALGVLAVRAGLLAEARAERGVAQRQRRRVEDLVGVVGRHRHLGGADEVEVLALDPVDVVGGLAEEAGALHRARPDQRRRDHLGEAGVAGLLHGQVDQRQLELGADAGEEVEARARHLGAALDVDGAEHPAELDVVARLEPLGGEVARRADRSRARCSRPRRRPGRRRAARLGIESTAACQASSASLWAASAALTSAASSLVRASRACFSSPWACGICLPSDFCSARLASKSAIAWRRRRVRGQRLVDHRVGQPALGLGGTHAVGLVTDDAGVDHVGKASRRGRERSPEIAQGITPAAAGAALGRPRHTSARARPTAARLPGVGPAVVPALRPGAGSRWSRAGVRSPSSTTAAHPRPTTPWTSAG